MVQSAEISLPGHRAERRRVDGGCGMKRTSSPILLAQFSSTELLFKHLYFPFLKFCREVMNEGLACPARKTAPCPHLPHTGCQIRLILSNHKLQFFERQGNWASGSANGEWLSEGVSLPAPKAQATLNPKKVPMTSFLRFSSLPTWISRTVLMG